MLVGHVSIRFVLDLSDEVLMDAGIGSSLILVCADRTYWLDRMLVLILILGHIGLVLHQDKVMLVQMKRVLFLFRQV